MSLISVEKIQATANAGANVDVAIEAAIMLAAQERRNVELRHNDVVYSVNWGDICDLVHRTGKDRK